MIIQEILQGESKKVEFKVELPKKSEKYMKLVIAFSNTNGGKIIIGIEDETHNIVGVDEKSVFEIVDSIANAISNSCTPKSYQTLHFRILMESVL